MRMTKLAFLLAALPAAAAVQAQQQASNVTIYGLVDTGVEYVNHASASGAGITRVTSGGMNTSRFGFRGTEDLGGGLKTVFQLEGGYFTDTGTGDGPLFKRQANVGLEGSYGRLTLGRSFTTVYDFLLPYDPMGYAPQYSWATSGNGTDKGGKYGMTTQFDNLIKYTTNFGGFKFGASYGLGEQADSAANSAKYAMGLNYGTGPLGVAATVERINGNTVPATGNRDKTTVMHLAASYQATEALSLKAGYRNFKKEAGAANVADLRADLYWAGANYQVTPTIGLTGVVYYQNEKNLAPGTDGDPIMYVLRAKYALSKRTDLYAVTAYAKAKNGQLVGLTRDSTADGGVTGFSSNQTGAMVGIQHRF